MPTVANQQSDASSNPFMMSQTLSSPTLDDPNDVESLLNESLEAPSMAKSASEGLPHNSEIFSGLNPKWDGNGMSSGSSGSISGVYFGRRSGPRSVTAIPKAQTCSIQSWCSSFFEPTTRFSYGIRVPEHLAVRVNGGLPTRLTIRIKRQRFNQPYNLRSRGMKASGASLRSVGRPKESMVEKFGHRPG